MSIDDLTGLITVILAISLASERLVTFLKTLIPQLADKAPGQVQVPQSDYIRQVIVMLLAFLSCWLTSSFLITDCKSFLCLKDPIDLKGSSLDIPVYLMALLASGGSAFWASLLGYTKAVKDIKKEQITQEKMASEKMLTERNITPAELKR